MKVSVYLTCDFSIGYVRRYLTISFKLKIFPHIVNTHQSEN